MSGIENYILTSSDAIALQAILSATQRKATVGRLAPEKDRVIIGQAQFIGSLPLMRPNHPAEARTDIRDLWLAVAKPPAPHSYWPVRDLIAEYRTGMFVVDFDIAAFEAAGGQGAVAEHLARWEAIQ